MAETMTCLMFGAARRLLDLLDEIVVNKEQTAKFMKLVRTFCDRALEIGANNLKDQADPPCSTTDLYNCFEAAINFCGSFTSSASAIVKLRGSRDAFAKFQALGVRLVQAAEMLHVKIMPVSNREWAEALMMDAPKVLGMLGNLKEHSEDNNALAQQDQDIANWEADFRALSEEARALLATETPASSPFVVSPTDFTNAAPSGVNAHFILHRALRSTAMLFPGRFRGQEVMIRKVPISGTQVHHQFLEDALQLRAITHPHVVSMPGLALDDKVGYIVMDFVDGLPLSVILQRQALSSSQVLGFSAMIAKALSYLHGARPRPIIHGKLTMHKIMVNDTLDNVKLVDFGYVRAKNISVLGGLLGACDASDLAFIAPEVMAHGSLGVKADVFSLGSVMYTLVARAPPFANSRISEDALICKVILGGRDTQPKLMPPKLWKLVEECWREIAGDRPDSSYILRQLVELVLGQGPDCDEHCLLSLLRDLDMASQLMESWPASRESRLSGSSIRSRASSSAWFDISRQQIVYGDLSDMSVESLLLGISGSVDYPILFQQQVDRFSSLGDGAVCPILARKEGITSAIGTLRAHGVNEGIQTLGLRLLRIIAQEPDFAKLVNAIRGSGVDPFIIAMSLHHSDGLLDDSTASVTSTPVEALTPSSLIITEGGLDVTLCAMRANKQQPRIQEEGCALLAHLALEDTFAAMFCETDGIDLISAAMCTHKGHVGIQGYGCLALRNLAFDKETTSAISQSGGIDLIVQAMASHRANIEVQDQACHALANIAANDIEGFEDTALVGRTIDALVVAMKTHKSSPRLQLSCFRALCNLAHAKDCLSWVGKLGGIEQVLSALRAFKDDREIQEVGCQVLGNLVGTNDTAFWGMYGGVIVFIVDAILSSMQFFSDSAAVQAVACATLANVASTFDNSTLVARVGGMDHVLQAMRTHKDDAAVQVEGCRVVSNIARAATDGAGIAECFEVIIASMHRHQHHVEVLAEGCRALGAVAKDPGRATPAVVRAVTAAMRHGRDSAIVQRNACWALLVIGSQNRSGPIYNEIRQCGGLGLVALARERHATDQALKARASILIHELS